LTPSASLDSLERFHHDRTDLTIGGTMVRKFVAVLFALALIGASVSAAQVGIGVSGQYLSL